MPDPAPPSFNKGRLLLIFFGLAVFIIGAWLVVKWQQPEPAPVPMVRPEPQAPEQPIAFYLARGDAARGEAYFRGRCGPCHTSETGAPHGIGPNLAGAMGNRIASRPDYPSYSTALSGLGGSWDWETTNRFLRSPREIAPGTRMTFAGVRNPQDRADVMLYLNRMGGSLATPAGAR
jgi:cytochrome c2